MSTLQWHPLYSPVLDLHAGLVLYFDSNRQKISSQLVKLIKNQTITKMTTNSSLTDLGSRWIRVQRTGLEVNGDHAGRVQWSEDKVEGWGQVWVQFNKSVRTNNTLNIIMYNPLIADWLINLSDLSLYLTSNGKCTICFC